MSLRYKNKSIINQRSASIDIDNTTDIEKIHTSHRSGSNINVTNVTTSELASNNKQTLVINDSFETINRNKSTFVGKDRIERVAENAYELKGFLNDSELTAFESWKNLYRLIANKNSQFKIKRGGIGYPGGDTTPLEGNRASNPVIGSDVTTVENTFSGYSSIPIRTSTMDQVATYSPVSIRYGDPASSRTIKVSDISKAAGGSGSNAPGVSEFGASASAATEGGSWDDNISSEDISNEISNISNDLFEIESQMGNGGDDVTFTKRNKIDTIGATFNDYPSIRIDTHGRSQPHEIIVGDTGAFKNHDYSPVIEDVDNSSIFPGGEYSLIVGNKFNIITGSGGINIKTSGPIELGGTTFKAGFKKFHISASHGIHLLSEDIVELASEKSITLRTNRQVFVESAMGIKNNLIVGGGIYSEGENYFHHITAPVEVQQTEDTILLGKMNTLVNRTLVIGETLVNGVWYPVYAVADDNLILNYSHSHHFKNLPLRLCESNNDVRQLAHAEGINTHSKITPALQQLHQKQPVIRA